MSKFTHLFEIANKIDTSDFLTCDDFEIIDEINNIKIDNDKYETMDLDEKECDCGHVQSEYYKCFVTIARLFIRLSC